MELNEDLRLYHRFKIDNPRLCYISNNGITLGSVTELSYGGFSLILPSKNPSSPKKSSRPSRENHTDAVEFHFLDKSIYCQVEERYAHQNRAGYQLKHEQTIVLSFLKEIIPWIRAGAALSYLQKLEREGFEGELPEYLTFEGPIPIDIEWLGLGSNKSPNFALNFTQDKVVYQLKKENDQLITLHNVWPGAESGELRTTQFLDSNILRNGLAIIVGLASYSENSTYGDLINTVLNLFETYQQSSNQLLNKKTG